MAAEGPPPPPEEKKICPTEEEEPPPLRGDSAPPPPTTTEKTQPEEIDVVVAEVMSAMDVWRPREVADDELDGEEVLDEWEDPRVAAVVGLKPPAKPLTELAATFPRTRPPEMKLKLYDAARALRVEALRRRTALEIAAYDGVVAVRTPQPFLATDYAPCLRAICAAEADREKITVRRRRFDHHLGHADDTIAAFAPPNVEPTTPMSPPQREEALTSPDDV